MALYGVRELAYQTLQPLRFTADASQQTLSLWGDYATWPPGMREAADSTGPIHPRISGASYNLETIMAGPSASPAAHPAPRSGALITTALAARHQRAPDF